ncbi:unnamed protein product [Ceratitis capitata]|uniref:(Mediterranean fruit fly) hypothetical protein n=1 Tax=Ceratitis capitata TaxID=7213 RepID=A0A811V4V2_CERCA|nr:unnamed protein product [Ceratitis capitata]
MRTIARCLIKLVDQRHHHRCRRRRRRRHEYPSQAQHQLTAFTSIDILQASSAVGKPMRSAFHVEWREACGAFGDFSRVALFHYKPTICIFDTPVFAPRD